MQVKSIAECSKGSILQYFRPSLSYRLSLRSLFCLVLSSRFTQALLYLLCTCLTLCMLGNFSCFCSVLFTFFKINFFKNSSRNTIRVSTGLDPDYGQCSVQTLLETERPRVPASLVSLRCVLEQDTLIPALYWFNPGRPVPT